jgi:hypothetical protein
MSMGTGQDEGASALGLKRFRSLIERREQIEAKGSVMAEGLCRDTAMDSHPVLKRGQEERGWGTRSCDSERRDKALSAEEGADVMRAHAARGGMTRGIVPLAMRREITAKLLEVCGLHAWYRDASGRSPYGKLCGPNKTPTSRSRGETALLKPLTKRLEIRPGRSSGRHRPRPLPCVLGREPAALLRGKMRKDGSNMLRHAALSIAPTCVL